MVGELVIEEGDLEVLRDRTNGSADDLEPVTVATAGGFLLSALGAGELATRGHAAADKIDSNVSSIIRDLRDYSASVNDSINAYAANENDSAVSFDVTPHGRRGLTGADLAEMRVAQ